ncbi:hypothetical protein [Pseudomonas syringae]|uniref:hypothetical protein n=1 Tax=Pseudomonas syringae TaxID=317 RepID=UPI0013C2C576|nr:hypothetical protein [Pseudomonas syringae]
MFIWLFAAMPFFAALLLADARFKVIHQLTTQPLKTLQPACNVRPARLHGPWPVYC